MNPGAHNQSFVCSCGDMFADRALAQRHIDTFRGTNFDGLIHVMTEGAIPLERITIAGAVGIDLAAIPAPDPRYAQLHDLQAAIVAAKMDALRERQAMEEASAKLEAARGRMEASLGKIAKLDTDLELLLREILGGIGGGAVKP